MSTARRNLYGWLAAGILAWTCLIVYAAVCIVPADIYLNSYYVADYRFGFVRRGLGGAVAGTVSGANFFDHARMVRWLIAGVYLVSLGAVMTALLRKHRSERTTMLALLIPVLPFGLPFAMYARPDLLGAAALIWLALSMTVADGPRRSALCCGVYGLFSAALVFLHEGIGCEFALGVVLAILVLPTGLTRRAEQVCAAVAVLPGLAAGLVIVVFARHDVGTRLCSVVPHRMVANPFVGQVSPQRFLDNLASGHTSDYHDWACQWYLPRYDYSFADGVREVASVGLPGLPLSFLLGCCVIAVSVVAVSYFSGVGVRTFRDSLQGRSTWVVCGTLLLVPVFMTGIDWIRFLIVVAFDVVIVYILYACNRPEVNDPPAPRTRRRFILTVIGFALVPMGFVPGGPVGSSINLPPG